MLVAAHDVLADVLVANWLFSAANRTTTRALELLAAAANEARLPSALIALDRLGAHAGFAEIDGLSVASALIDCHPDQARQSCGLFLGGVLLELEQKLELLHTSPLIRDTADAPEFDIVLSFLADDLVRRKTDRALPALITLIDMLDAACDRRSYGNMILRRSYALNPDRIPGPRATGACGLT